MESAFWQGLWQGVFQLLALGVVASWVNFVYQRYRERSSARRELVDEIDAFSVSLYKPRKIYLTFLDPAGHPLGSIEDPALRETRRTDVLLQCHEDLVTAIGRFRALQVKIVPLFGYDVEMFGYYLAIWRYLKEIRLRMERRESLFDAKEGPESADAFYRLIDSFRYRVQVEPFAREKPGFVLPPADLLAAMKRRGDAIHADYFGRKTPRPEAA